MDYLIDYDLIKGKTVAEALKLIHSRDGIPVSNLRIKDLLFLNEKEIYPGTGVYLFRQEKEIKYVGKVSSMSFVERIPKHFDPRSYAWMNRLLELNSGLKKEIENQNYKTGLRISLKEVLSCYNLILIHINCEESDKTRINDLETILRGIDGPMNQFKAKKTDLKMTISV